MTICFNERINVRVSVPYSLACRAMSVTMATAGLSVSSSCYAQHNQWPFALIKVAPLYQNQPFGVGYAINSTGDMTGSLDTVSNTFDAIVWHDSGSMAQELGNIAGNFSEGRSINDTGDIAGWSTYQPNGNEFQPHAVLWHNGQVMDLGTLGGDTSTAYGINNLGQVVGYSYTTGNVSAPAFIWENGTMQALPDLVQPGGIAFAINNKSQIVGQAYPAFPGSAKAVTWENGGITALPSLSDPSVAFAINDLGWIVGQSEWANGPNVHAVLWVNGNLSDIHGQGLGQSSAAFGLNNNNVAVGYVGSPPTRTQGFVWTQAGGMRTIDSLLPPRRVGGFSVAFAYGINDANQIVGYGIVPANPLDIYSVFVSQVHPSLTLSNANPGIAGQTNSLTLTGAQPGQQVSFYYSLHGGGTRIPGCDLQQNALQLDNAVLIGTVTADSSGNATVTGHVPTAAHNKTILFQADVQGQCAVSQLVVQTFE